MRSPRLNDERGMALAMAIFALVVIGALVAGTFFTGQMEQRTGRNSVYAIEAAQAAEAGSPLVLSDWDQFNLNNLPGGDSLILPVQTMASRITYKPTVTRLNPDLFLIRTLGTRTAANGTVLAQRSVGTLVRLMYVTANAKAAVTVSKPIKFNGNAYQLIGNDSVPAGWGTDPTCTTSGDLAGIRSDTTTGATSQDADNIFGNPPEVPYDPTITNDFFNIFGDVTFDELKTSADIVLTDGGPFTGVAPTVTGAIPQRCNLANTMNWGEPRRGAGSISQCYNYFPIIYESGPSLKLTTGRGQGLLLLEGDLEIAGNFEFTGLIVAKGGIKLNGNGNKITGALLSMDVAIDDLNSISGNTTLQFSSCALNKAIQGSAFAEPFSARSWVQLY